MPESAGQVGKAWLVGPGLASAVALSDFAGEPW